MTSAPKTTFNFEMMKRYVWIQYSNGDIQQVEQDTALYVPFIDHQKQFGFGSRAHPIALPPRITAPCLNLVFKYCRFHSEPGHSKKECKIFNEEYIKMNPIYLCAVSASARILELDSLVNLTSKALSRNLKGKSSQEMRDIMGLPDDLTEEEKLEPLENKNNDPRIRLLNKLYAKKLDELKKGKEKKAETGTSSVDDRSVDELLSFINGENKDSNGASSSINNKKNRKSKNQKKKEKNKHRGDGDEKDKIALAQ